MPSFGGARWRTFVVDRWASLAHKAPMDHPATMVKSWVPTEDQRRLTAYTILGAYLENTARELLRTTVAAERREHREYGDAGLIVSRIVSGILGDQVQITVEGADTIPPDTPTLPTRPGEPPADADDAEKAAYEAALRVWRERAAQTVSDWEDAWRELPALQERQEWLREWAEREMFDQAVWEAETDAVGLGDGVYVLWWSSRQNRPKIDLYDPGHYFPVLDDEAARLGYPTKVHMAFEVDLDGDGTADHVRRLTWELGPIEGERTPDIRRGGRTEPGLIVTDPVTGSMVPKQGDRLAESGGIQRAYPWDTEHPSGLTCYHTDATWALRDTDGKDVAEFPMGGADYALNEDGTPIRRLDLMIDFIPVIHIPNTPARRDHFGQSSLARVLQLLDDVADVDSDLVAASALAGTPMVGLSGVTATDVVVRPGAVWGLGQDGKLSTIDLSASVTALQGVIGELLERVSVIIQLPGEVLGRVDATGPESGFARSLKVGPYKDLIGLLRLVRDPKYRLFLRFVQRLAQAGQDLEPGPTPDATLAFGSFLPADRKEAVDLVVALLDAKGISRRSALQLLQDVGIEVGDLVEELARIEAEDIEGAEALFAATGDEPLVRARLGLPASDEEDEPPAPTLPGPAAPGLILPNQPAPPPTPTLPAR